MKKRIVITSIISIFLVSILLIGSTYSIFTSQEIDETANVYTTGNLNVSYKVSSNTVHFTDTTPMTAEEADSVIPYRITVTNTGNVAYEFDVILSDTTSSEENTIDYQYIMTKVGYLEPISLSNCTNNIIKENVVVPAGKSVDIDIRFWLDSTLPNTEMGNSFYAKLMIDGLAVHNDNEDIDNSSLSLRYMNTTNGTNYFNSETYRNYVTTASFVDYIDTSNASVNSETNEKIMWDMSTAQDNSVIAWLEDSGTTDENGNKLYDLYIGSKEKIYAKSLSRFFYSMSGLLSISFNNLDTSLTTDMAGMFTYCSSLTSLDLSDFNTINVINMGSNLYDGMFMNCSSLTSLDLSGFNTRNVKYLDSVFGACSNLLNIDLSNFDTSKVVSMRRMFHNCSSLTELDLSNFDTSKVTNMIDIFHTCTSLTKIDVSNFDTSNVNNMQNMFFGCSSLTELDVSNFDTSNVYLMGEMFLGCSSLTELDVSNFDTSNVENMWYMFYRCSSLTELDISNFDTSNVIYMNDMFSCCSSLKNLNLGDFDTSSVIDIKSLFYGCNNLSTNLTINGTKITSYTVMFNGAATAEGASITVYYVGDNPTTADTNESTESLVEAMIATANGGNIINGGCTGDYCSM